MTQRQVDRMLKWGIVFSLLWLAGIGSIVALLLGWKAITAIKASNGTLVGAGRGWWCLIVGGLGLLFWLPLVIVGISNQF
jgi:hypothetical protein